MLRNPTGDIGLLLLTSVGFVGLGLRFWFQLLGAVDQHDRNILFVDWVPQPAVVADEVTTRFLQDNPLLALWTGEDVEEFLFDHAECSTPQGRRAG